MADISLQKQPGEAEGNGLRRASPILRAVPVCSTKRALVLRVIQ